MNSTTKATIEFVIDKYKLRRDHDTAGNLIDALKKDGKGTAVQNLTEAMAANEMLSRSTFIIFFLSCIYRDSETDKEEKQRVTIKPKEMLFPEKPSSIKYRCNHWTGSSMCSNRASILLVTDTEPIIAFGLCTDHQYGDLTKIPIAQARALPWEDVIPVEELNESPAGSSENVGLIMKYFVLKPAGDTPYHVASRAAMKAYADFIEDENMKLAEELREWEGIERRASFKRTRENIG